jgi:RNA recognition motif-containing protein
MSVKLHVGNISFKTTSQDLHDLFATVGSVTSCDIIEDRMSGRSRGFGFIEMASQAESENAIAQLNGRELDSREITVALAKPKEPRGQAGETHGDYQSENYTGYTSRAYMS